MCFVSVIDGQSSLFNWICRCWIYFCWFNITIRSLYQLQGVCFVKDSTTHQEPHEFDASVWFEDVDSSSRGIISLFGSVLCFCHGKHWAKIKFIWNSAAVCVFNCRFMIHLGQSGLHGQSSWTSCLLYFVDSQSLIQFHGSINNAKEVRTGSKKQGENKSSK